MEKEGGEKEREQKKLLVMKYIGGNAWGVGLWREGRALGMAARRSVRVKGRSTPSSGVTIPWTPPLGLGTSTAGVKGGGGVSGSGTERREGRRDGRWYGENTVWLGGNLEQEGQLGNGR